MRKPREYNAANQLVATRTYSSPSPFSSLVPLTFTYFCYNSLGQRTLAVEDMNRNGQIDFESVDRVVSNDVRYVTYNGENRPIHWVRESDNTTITMSYDHMGRRRSKNAQRFFYDGYLQICSYNSPTPNCYIWDPTEPVATRPLMWQTGSGAYLYAHDGNKNVSEVIAENGDISTHYEYAPFGEVIAQHGELAGSNPWRFSSEFADDILGLVYYNYRHYESVMGRWLSRDLIDEFGGINLYEFVRNSSFLMIDMLGNGLLDWFQCWLAGGRYQNSNCCCGGFSLNFVTHCCVDGNQYEKDGEVVAIEYKVKNGDSLQGGMNLLPMHYWLEWGINERVDANIKNIERGEVVYSIVPHTELGYNPILPYQKYLPEKNREIKASRCRGENPDVFRACLTRRAKADNGTASRMLCHEYDERLIDYCRKESKK